MIIGILGTLTPCAIWGKRKGKEKKIPAQEKTPGVSAPHNVGPEKDDDMPPPTAVHSTHLFGGKALPRNIMTIDEITVNFALLDDWDDRYRYIIELGRKLEPMPEAARIEANKVSGCASQVWLVSDLKRNGLNEPVLRFTGDSDAYIVRGLIAILLAACSGKPARQVLEVDTLALFDRLGLREHLTPQRSNGFKSMVGRIRSDAHKALTLGPEPGREMTA
jgi:cysteine desulfuration protein SufE